MSKGEGVMDMVRESARQKRIHRQTDGHERPTNRSPNHPITNHLAVSGRAARRGQGGREGHLDGARLVGFLP